MSFEWSQHLPLFALAFSSLFPLVNPIGTALIIEPYFLGVAKAERKYLALKITVYCFILGFLSLHTGSLILEFMGVSIPTTQLAGGLIIAKLGLSLLDAKQDMKEDDHINPNLSDAIFYPLAFPLTLGPGCISALITLSAKAHEKITFFSANMMVITAALFVVLVITYFCFAYASEITKRIGKSGSLVLNRLCAFLVFCIGIQMAFTGLMRMMSEQGLLAH
jgi:multiple antibiotic resistance protein